MPEAFVERPRPRRPPAQTRPPPRAASASRIAGCGATGDSDSDTTSRIASDGFDNLSEVSDAVRVSLEPQETRGLFRSPPGTWAGDPGAAGGTSHPVPFTPGAWMLHTEADPLFTEGESGRGEKPRGLPRPAAFAGSPAAKSTRYGFNGGYY